MMLVYLSLFGFSFLSATLIPFSSELVLLGLLAEGYDTWWLWLAATLGNTLGAVVNWWLGRYLLHFEERRWFPFKREKLQRYQDWFQRFGVWSLLFAWLPAGGDALTFIAGMMKVRFFLFLVLVGTGKAARYAVVIWFSNQVL